MAITISGENNNDKILASDGVIDQISGINIVGVITATSFTGDLTGNVTGNLTGNVNSTSPLLLQTGGSERFRITGNNELGIAGANYGSSGQVLTSGGSGSSVTWSAIPTQVTIANNADNRVITGGSGTNLVGESKLTFDGTGLLHLNNSTGSSDAVLKLESESGSDAKLTLDTSNGGGAGAHIEFRIDGTLKGGISYVSNASASDTHDIIFKNNSNTERLRIDSSGRIGVGVVPTAQFAHNLIQIGHQATLGANASLSTTGQTFLTHNLYFDTGGTYQVFNTSSANAVSYTHLRAHET